MLTVLDHFVSRWLEDYRLDIENLPPAKRFHVRRLPRGNPVGRLQWELRDALARPPLDHTNMDVTEQQSWEDLQRRLAPFLLPELCHLPVALDISRAAMEPWDFVELVRTCDSFFEEHTCLYIHTSKYVGTNLQAHLEAIFANRETDGTRTWGAILANRDRSSFYFLKWSETRHSINILPGHTIGSQKWLLGNIGNLTAYGFMEALLAVHNHLNPPKGNGIPDREENEARKAVACNTATPLRRFSGIEGFGRFRLIDVPGKRVPSLAVTAKAVEGKDHRSLTHQVTVRAHGRWQAHGPNWSLRRWITVQRHTRGPAGALEDTRIRMKRIK